MRKIIIFSGIALLAACVPARKFDETVAKYETSVAENKVLKEKAMTAEEKYNELTVSTDQMRKDMEAVKRDTSVMGRSLRNLTVNYDQLDKTYRELLDVNDRLNKGNAQDAEILRKKYENKLSELHSLQDQANQLKTIYFIAGLAPVDAAFNGSNFVKGHALHKPSFLLFAFCAALSN